MLSGLRTLQLAVVTDNLIPNGHSAIKLLLVITANSLILRNPILRGFLTVEVVVIILGCREELVEEHVAWTSRVKFRF